MRLLCIILLTSLLALMAGTTPVAAVDFSSLVVFGDSLSDAGNIAAANPFPPSPPYFDGRITNGPSWVDILAERLDVPTPRASEVGGTNYAFGGATTGSNRQSETDMVKQVASYLSSNTPAADDLFVFWGGVNDFNRGQPDPALPIQFISNHILAVIDAGARNVLVVNIPETLGQYDYPLASESNQELSQVVATLSEDHDDVTITLFDYVEFFDFVLAKPHSFGFKNMVDPACRNCGVGTVLAANAIVPNPDEYFFWDNIHPSAAAHQLIGEHAFAALLREHEEPWGDFNSDGVLDLADYQILIGNMNMQSTTTFDGDMDFDGFVSLDDFALFRREYERNNASALVAVPEPNCQVLALLGLVGLLTRRRR